jgi:di/tricarboxylate transporter
VDWPTLIFATGALAIGAAAEATGLSEWIMARLVPSALPSATGVFLGYVATVGYILHLFVGSTLAALSVLTPPLVGLAARLGLPSFAPALLVYTTAVMGIALPFHNLMILVGVGRVGHFNERQTLKFFPALTAVTILVVAFQIGWWMLLGRL